VELKNVLLLYKKSAYKIYFLEKKGSFQIKNRPLIQEELGRFKKAHDEHYATLKTVETVLRKYKICFLKVFRGQRVDYDKYDLVITIGGDGTFLEAARRVRKNIILGVNSSLSYSVGRFCPANVVNFESVFKRILRKDFKVNLFQRLRLEIDGYPEGMDCLNDVLVCHSHPAAMSRYVLRVGDIKEEQRCGGIWIAAPAGSSGVILSAGGKILESTDKRIQYMPRELYAGRKRVYRLRGEVLPVGQGINIISLMRKGMVYVDGTHFEFPFPFGAMMKVKLSSCPLKAVDIEKETPA
jgi:NAD+ kinase